MCARVHNRYAIIVWKRADNVCVAAQPIIIAGAIALLMRSKYVTVVATAARLSVARKRLDYVSRNKNGLD